MQPSDQDEREQLWQALRVPGRWARAHALELSLAAAPAVSVIVGYSIAKSFYIFLGVGPWDAGLSVTDIVPSVALGALLLMFAGAGGSSAGLLSAFLVGRLSRKMNAVASALLAGLGAPLSAALVFLVFWLQRYLRPSRPVSSAVVDFVLYTFLGALLGAPAAYQFFVRRLVRLPELAKAAGSLLGGACVAFGVSGLFVFVYLDPGLRSVTGLLRGERTTVQPLPFGFGPPVRFVRVIPLSGPVAEVQDAGCVLSVGVGPRGHLLIAGDGSSSKVYFVDPQLVALASAPSCALLLPVASP